jgi:serine/threonine protein kinase
MARDVEDRRIAGRYELGAQLGEGGVGIVWRATDTLLGREVAIKEVELPPAVRDKQRAVLRARIIREARAAARLSHPGAVTLFDVVQDGGQDYIVMELIDAPTLDQLVAEEGPLEPRHAAMIGLRLLATLEAAHRAGIVHRDVKPSNVMVREDGTTKLTDFGTASVTGDPELTVTGVVVGSPAFMSPEQIKGLEIGPATDLWALGATLYFAVEGEPPFKSTRTHFEVLNAIVNDPPRPGEHLGRLAPVVDRLLTKEPEARPSSADVWYALRRVAAGQADPPPDPPEPHEPPDRSAIYDEPEQPDADDADDDLEWSAAEAGPDGDVTDADAEVAGEVADADAEVAGEVADADAEVDPGHQQPDEAEAEAEAEAEEPEGLEVSERPEEPEDSPEGLEVSERPEEPPGAVRAPAPASMPAAAGGSVDGGGTWLRRRLRRSGG